MMKSIRRCQQLPVRYRNRNRGFTLLEVLVSLLVLSIGLIGVAGLQLLGVSNSRDAYFRTQAVMLSYDISDRMRANIQAVEDGNYNGATGSQVSGCWPGSSAGDGCTPAQMAADDVARWKQALVGLPGGEGVVCIDSSFGDGSGEGAPECDSVGTQFVVKVWWDNDRDATTPKELLTTVFVP